MKHYMTMKKIFAYLVALSSCLLMTSCVTAVGAETIDGAVVVRSSTAVEYYDYDNNYVVIYIDGIPTYRLWDSRYSRYYYRPVPRERFGFIRHRHLPPAPRHHYIPRLNPRPGHHGLTPHVGRTPQINHHSNGHIGGSHRPGGHSMNNRSGGSSHHSGGGSHGHFGGRR